MGRRKKEPKAVHRENIASAASVLFMENGITATSMSDIAEAAGYSKATLYVYFENKEEIIGLLVLESMQKLYGYIVTALEEQQTTRASRGGCRRAPDRAALCLPRIQRHLPQQRSLLGGHRPAEGTHRALCGRREHPLSALPGRQHQHGKPPLWWQGADEAAESRSGTKRLAMGGLERLRRGRRGRPPQCGHHLPQRRAGDRRADTLHCSDARFLHYTHHGRGPAGHHPVVCRQRLHVPDCGRGAAAGVMRLTATFPWSAPAAPRRMPAPPARASLHRR